jgi:hypothetical protein
METVYAMATLQDGQGVAEKKTQIAEKAVTDIGALLFHTGKVSGAEAGPGTDGDGGFYLRIIDNDEFGVDVLIGDLRQFMNVGQERLHFGRLKKPLVPDQFLIVGNDADGGVEALDGPLKEFDIHKSPFHFFHNAHLLAIITHLKEFIKLFP